VEKDARRHLSASGARVLSSSRSPGFSAAMRRDGICDLVRVTAAARRRTLSQDLLQSPHNVRARGFRNTIVVAFTGLSDLTRGLLTRQSASELAFLCAPLPGRLSLLGMYGTCMITSPARAAAALGRSATHNAPRSGASCCPSFTCQPKLALWFDRHVLRTMSKLAECCNRCKIQDTPRSSSPRTNQARSFCFCQWGRKALPIEDLSR
jgi:hypothetical protein